MLLTLAIWGCTGDTEVETKTSFLVTIEAADLDALKSAADTIGLVVDPDTEFQDSDGNVLTGDYSDTISFEDVVTDDA